MTEQELLSALEAIIYAADEPATLDQIVAAITGEKTRAREAAPAEAPAENSAELQSSLSADATRTLQSFDAPADTAPESSHSPDASRAQVRAEIRSALDKLVASYAADERGIEIRKVAGGWKMYTKAQHHELVRRFIKALRPPLRLTMPALETLSVIAYKQPATLPEINEIRGVNCGGVVKTLLERRLITTAGRKDAVGRPILYRTSKDFLMRFGLADLDELPSLKEFEQLAQAALGADDGIAPTASEESPQESEAVTTMAGESEESPAQSAAEAPAESSSPDSKPAASAQASATGTDASVSPPSDPEPREKSAGA